MIITKLCTQLATILVKFLTFFSQDIHLVSTPSCVFTTYMNIYRTTHKHLHCHPLMYTLPASLFTYVHKYSNYVQAPLLSLINIFSKFM